jgi:chromosome partitioning protein
MILVLGSIKGGVGKTTLALNIAIALARSGDDVLVVDGDEQRTAAEFTELREAGRPGAVGYTAIELSGAAIRTQCRQLKSKYTQIVIDVGGRDSGSLRAALTVADVVLIPVQPRCFDLWATDRMVDLVAEAREINGGLRAAAVLNQADAQGKDNGHAKDYIDRIEGLELAPGQIVRRKVYPNAANLGQSVFDLSDPAQKQAAEQAREDINGLVHWLYGEVGTERKRA